MPSAPNSSTLVITCQASDYCASTICRAVEDCDAHVLNLNVISAVSRYGEMQVALRVDHRYADSVMRSLERFGYETIHYESPCDDLPSTEMARSRANELLRYLNV